MLIINNRFLSVYDYNFLLYYEKIFSVNQPKDQRFKAEDKILPVKILIMAASNLFFTGKFLGRDEEDER